MQNTAPEQKRIMRFLPLVFGIVLLRFPAGLFVYWVSSNVISIFQNLLIYRNIPKPNFETEEAETTDVDVPEDDGYQAETDDETASLDRPTPNGNSSQHSETGQTRRTKKRR